MKNYFLILFSLLSLVVSAHDKRPNIIFIFADDLAWNGLTSYGNKKVHTPHLDKLVAEGLKFTDAYAMPQCSPSRSAFLTGQYCARTGMTAVVKENHVLPHARLTQPEAVRTLPADAYNIAKMMRDAGYLVGFTGKWHVDISEKENKKEQGVLPYFKRYGFDLMKSTIKEEDDQHGVMNKTKAALGYLNKNRDKPVLAYVAHTSVHTPLKAPKKLIDKYVNQGYERSPSPFCNSCKVPPAEYLAMIDYLDQSIGILMEGIKKLQLNRETLVIFMSDNGGLDRVWDSAPLRGFKGSQYEGGVRVPLVIHWPEKIKHGRVSNIPVHLVDLFPTFMELAGGAPKQDYILDGESLLPIIKGEKKLKREAIFMHHPHYIPHYYKVPSGFVRKGDYKLICFYGDHLKNEKEWTEIVPELKFELYNLKNDISEQEDLAEIMPNKVEELKGLFDQWLIETKARMPVANENFRLTKWTDRTSSVIDYLGNLTD